MTRKSYQGSKPEKLYSNTYSCLVPTPHPPWERIKVIMLALTPPLGDYVLCVCSLSLKAGLTTPHHMLKVSSFLWPHPSSPSWQDNFFVMIGNGCGQIQHRYTIFTYLRFGGRGPTGTSGDIGKTLGHDGFFALFLHWKVEFIKKGLCRTRNLQICELAEASKIANLSV